MNPITNAPGSGLASSASGPATPTLSCLPAELFCAVVELLDLRSFKNLRLTDRHLARETLPFLSLPSFTGLSWRKDMMRLRGLSELPECAARIRDVKFVFAAMDEYRAYHDSFSHMFGFEPEVRTERLLDMWRGYQESQMLARRNLRGEQPLENGGEGEGEGEEEQSKQMRTRGTVATTKTLCLSFPVELVDRTLRGLPNLRRLKLTWMECPWNKDVERVFEADESVKLQKDSAREVQREFVRTLWTLDTPLERLEVGGFLLSEADLLDLDLDLGRVPATGALASLRTLEVEMANLPDEQEESREAALKILMRRMDNLVVTDDATE